MEFAGCRFPLGSSWLAIHVSRPTCPGVRYRKQSPSLLLTQSAVIGFRSVTSSTRLPEDNDWLLSLDRCAKIDLAKKEPGFAVQLLLHRNDIEPGSGIITP